MSRKLLAACTSLLLGGCAAVSADQTVPAFAQAAEANRAAFQAARAAEADAYEMQALNAASNSGSVRSQHCIDPAEAVRCTVSITVDGKPVDLGAKGPNVARLSSLVADYADKMMTLAAAADIAERKAALSGLAKTAGAIALAAGIPGVDAISQFIIDLADEARMNSRRKILYAVAEEVDPAIQRLAPVMTTEGVLLQRNIVLANSQAVADIETRMGSLPSGDFRRVAMGRQLIAAAADERRAASVTVDFSTLGAAHATMVASLARPKVNLKQASRDIEALYDQAEAIKAAFVKKEGAE